jgi:REP element-mobilizing transposase RayT
VSYDPEKHHRRSIRLKGHDYAGGGVYFVTICAHREFIAWGNGHPFVGATCVSPVPPARRILEEEWMRSGEIRDDVSPGEFVVMPDHFHGLIRIEKGKSALGHVIGAFKAAVTRAIRRTGGMHVAPHAALRIWHRNYYERIVRSEEAERKITEYIRMNPWRCVQELGDGLRGIGNPSLRSREKLGVLCSRGAPKIGQLPEADVYFGGWHSPKEKEIFQWLLDKKLSVIACPAWGIEKSSFAPGVLRALEENRLLILEMRDISGNLAAAEARNRFVIENADTLFTPHVSKGGMLERLLNAADSKQDIHALNLEVTKQ